MCCRWIIGIESAKSLITPWSDQAGHVLMMMMDRTGQHCHVPYMCARTHAHACISPRGLHACKCFEQQAVSRACSKAHTRCAHSSGHVPCCKYKPRECLAVIRCAVRCNASAPGGVQGHRTKLLLRKCSGAGPWVHACSCRRTPDHAIEQSYRMSIPALKSSTPTCLQPRQPEDRLPSRRGAGLPPLLACVAPAAPGAHRAQQRRLPAPAAARGL